ncbi:splicing factor 3B subunit 2 [Microplitis mediator]|uniref:splicing factor 3B subunit 2 n=1 Tax=Microplitis mediator TaxID=375433 RepID=UPI002554D07C|nr:splicing factor 3B subunit 2 [Microplitis mediator]XP_057337057.1 splicing factor 3B subunit 2 [Microplitis mediator]XP_057337058.1 splicing factor 3B subunit 2 [Microplitis mediator]
MGDQPKTLPSLLSLKLPIPVDMQQNPGAPDPVKEHEEDEEVKLPAALEQALAFKNERAKELGADPNEISVPGTSPPREIITRDETPMDFVSENGGTVIEKADSNNKSNNKTLKKKKKKKKKKHTDNKISIMEKSKNIENSAGDSDAPEVEYIQEIPTITDLEPMYRQFARVFEIFRIVEPDAAGDKDKGEANGQYPSPVLMVPSKVPILDDFDDDGGPQQQNQLTENGVPRLSKRKLKRLNRLSVAELKQLVGRPDVVEMHDVTARDPKLLVQLKAHRNTVPVPRHWCFKRKYLQGKRGIEKPPFDLPDFIKRTGITEMRASLQERDDGRTLKAKMRERARPKLGKIDIDYQKLHDAFFKWQTKPRMTIHGDLYYEGKEFETRLKEKKPGELSDELRTALGMPVGPNCHKVPPPWLIAMQRYGPPPSYPNLKIPGLNAPIPEGCAFGYHAGGWGKPPVDETGRPLYGDVFGVARPPGGDIMDEEVDRGMWGEPESESSGEEDEDEDGEEGEGDGDGKDVDADGSGLITPGAEGLITPSGIASIPAGLETPETIELRKKKIESEMEGGDTPALYTVLQERRTEGLGASMMGSTHVYDMTGAGGQAPPSVIAAARRGMSGSASESRVEKDGTVEVALDPSELDLDSEAMASRYEETMRSRQAHLRREDLSDMLQDHVQRQKSKRKRQQGQSETKSSKKYKEFKF